MGVFSAVGHFVGSVAGAAKDWCYGAYSRWQARRMAKDMLGSPEPDEQLLGGGPTPTGGRVNKWAVYFSPSGGCTDAIVALLERAKKTVLVQAYGFTSVPIREALVAAHRRGVHVRIVLDSDGRTGRSSQGDECASAGIEVTWDAKHLIAHNKVMVVDARVVVTGSFNFSASAETRNAENLLVIDDPQLAALYSANWELHRGHSVP